MLRGQTALCGDVLGQPALVYRRSSSRETDAVLERARQRGLSWAASTTVCLCRYYSIGEMERDSVCGWVWVCVRACVRVSCLCAERVDM